MSGKELVALVIIVLLGIAYTALVVPAILVDQANARLEAIARRIVQQYDDEQKKGPAGDGAAE